MMDQVHCPNSDCPDFQKTQGSQKKKHIIRHGRTRKGIRRFKCKTCGKTFTETVNTTFYREKSHWYYYLMARSLKSLTEGVPLRDIASELDINPQVLLGLINVTMKNREKIERRLRISYNYSAQKIEEFWILVNERLSDIQYGTSRDTQ